MRPDLLTVYKIESETNIVWYHLIPCAIQNCYYYYYYIKSNSEGFNDYFYFLFFCRCYLINFNRPINYANNAIHYINQCWTNSKSVQIKKQLLDYFWLIAGTGKTKKRQYFFVELNKNPFLSLNWLINFLNFLRTLNYLQYHYHHQL